MGLTNSKQILARIQNQYKSLRKYYDPVYGQITVIQHKTSRRQFALCQKVFLKSNQLLLNCLNQPQKDHYLLKLQHFDSCDLSLCSDLKLYFFLFEYAPHTLEHQITKRINENNPFNRDEAITIFLQQVDITQLLSQRNNPETGRANRFLLSNSNFLCSPLLELRTLEPFFRNEPQGQDQFEKCYLSPQAFKAHHRGQIYRIRQICCRQSSLVFTTALNIIQCLLLADISQIYQNKGQQVINYGKLTSACEQILSSYGQDIYIILLKMTQPLQIDRLSLQQVKNSIQKLKGIRIYMQRYQKEGQIEIC